MQKRAVSCWDSSFLFIYFLRLLVIECITNGHCVLYIGYALYIRTCELLEEIHSCYLFFYNKYIGLLVIHVMTKGLRHRICILCMHDTLDIRLCKLPKKAA